jgi:hypothetical protein
MCSCNTHSLTSLFVFPLFSATQHGYTTTHIHPSFALSRADNTITHIHPSFTLSRAHNITTLVHPPFALPRADNTIALMLSSFLTFSRADNTIALMLSSSLTFSRADNTIALMLSSFFTLSRADNNHTFLHRRLDRRTSYRRGINRFRWVGGSLSLLIQQSRSHPERWCPAARRDVRCFTLLPFYPPFTLDNPSCTALYHSLPPHSSMTPRCLLSTTL